MKYKDRLSKTLILGGGLAGVSTAYHLKKLSFQLIEKGNELGGTARSFKVGKFTFDFTGHLLHLHFPYTRKLIRKLLKDNFYSCERNAQIFSHQTYTPYPFQANTHGLPQSVVDECVLGFFQAFLKNKKNGRNIQKLNFKDWCLAIFGKGISKEFMLPYNEKLYQVSPQSMGVDWCGPFVPKVLLEEVIQGGLIESRTDFGYNTQFLYPKKGGIQVLAQSLAKNLKNISLNTSIKKLDWKNKIATLSDGKKVSYRNVVNTIPLKDFLNLFQSLPSSVEKARKSLRSVGILCLNIGINRPHISKASWIYFPEKKYPFYRVGFPMNFTPHVVPRGCSSMYVEVPFKHVRSMKKSQIVKEVKKGLIDARILRKTDKWVETQFLPIPTAYVVYDRVRARALRTIFKFLELNSIQSIGRYGAWKYSFMEEAIIDGKKAAEKILASKN